VTNPVAPAVQGETAAAPAAVSRPKWFRPKGYLGRSGVAVVLLLIGATLLMVLARATAMPGSPVPDWWLFEPLRRIGALLNDSFTLQWVPVADRHAITYLLMLPAAVLLITIARLTFGLRVLGFRSIVIAAGFQEIGVLPSLVVIALVLGIVVSLRPTMRRAGLPLFARLSMILGIAACTLVAALFVGPWLRSELIWSLAFFPVIIVALLAESIASSLDRQSPGTAAWRLGWTLLVALLLQVLLSSPTALEIALRFPELMLTQLMVIVLVSEYFDLRLLEGWPDSPDGIAAALTSWLRDAPPAPRRPRVAVVRNRWSRGVIANLGPAAPAKGRVGSVQHIVDALRDEGYEVKVFEGDMSLLRDLQGFLAPHPRTGQAGGVVLNLAAGIQGRGRFCHVPAMLEMAGVAYTGPDPVAHARTQDRYALLTTLQQAGVAAPAFRVVAAGSKLPSDIALPALVSSRTATDPVATLVKTAQEFDAAVEKLAAGDDREVLVETWLGGAEYRITLIGNADLDCLPLMRVDALSKERHCPAPINDALAERIRDCARRAYRAAGCRDYARIDLRLGAEDAPCVVHVQSQDILARAGSVAAMGAAAGLGWRELARRIVVTAAARQRVDAAALPRSDNVVPLARGTSAAAAAIAGNPSDAARRAAGTP
jgi:D-alanine-D-alanine ligase